MKKVLAMVLLVALVATAAVAIVACDYEENIVIEFYSTMGQKLQAVIETYIKEFNKIYPDITIKHVVQTSKYPQLYTNINTELTSGKGPSVAYCYPDHVAAYLKKNAVVSLDSYINSTEMVEEGRFGNTSAQPIGLGDVKNDFVETFYNENYQAFGEDSPMYTLPFAKSSEVIYYDKDFFTANNIPLPTHWWCDETCDADCNTSMEKVCQRIRELDSNSIPLGYDSEANLFITLCEQFQTLPENAGKTLYTSVDGQHYRFDNDVTKGFVTKLNDWYAKKYFTTSTLYGNFTSGLFTSTEATRCYMCIGSTGGASYQSPKSDRFTVGIAKIPYIKGGEMRVISQGPSVVMLKNKNNATEEHQLASWLWIKFLTTNLQLQAQFSMVSGYTPVLKTVEDDPVYSEYLNSTETGTNNEERILALATKTCLSQQDAYYTSPAFNGSSEARVQIETLVAACLAVKEENGKTIAQQLNEKFAQAVNICETYAPSINK